MTLPFGFQPFESCAGLCVDLHHLPQQGLILKVVSVTVYAQPDKLTHVPDMRALDIVGKLGTAAQFLLCMFAVLRRQATALAKVGSSAETCGINLCSASSHSPHAVKLKCS